LLRCRITRGRFLLGRREARTIRRKVPKRGRVGKFRKVGKKDGPAACRFAATKIGMGDRSCRAERHSRGPETTCQVRGQPCAAGTAARRRDMVAVSGNLRCGPVIVDAEF
jgi:hypothetical protein